MTKIALAVSPWLSFVFSFFLVSDLDFIFMKMLYLGTETLPYKEIAEANFRIIQPHASISFYSAYMKS